MHLLRTDLVRPEDERPARRDGTCFYCSQPLGTKHRPECVIVSKTVVVRVQVDVVIDVPASWSLEMVEFARNEGSWCADNILRDLGTWIEKENRNCGCACNATEIRFLRDAAQEDHEQLPLLVEEKDMES